MYTWVHISSMEWIHWDTLTHKGNRQSPFEKVLHQNSLQSVPLGGTQLTAAWDAAPSGCLTHFCEYAWRQNSAYRRIFTSILCVHWCWPWSLSLSRGKKKKKSTSHHLSGFIAIFLGKNDIQTMWKIHTLSQEPCMASCTLPAVAGRQVPFLLIPRTAVAADCHAPCSASAGRSLS